MTDALNVGATPISELIGASVATVAPEADLYAVADGLAGYGVGALVVQRDGDRDDVVGVVSERDLVGVLAARKDPAATRAGDVANRDLVWCDVEATLAEVAGQMMEHYVRHVLVEQDGRLVGVVSARDVLGVYASAEAELEEEAREAAAADAEAALESEM